MIDIETLGIERGSVLLSIGACQWNPADGIVDTFYTEIDSSSCQQVGLSVDEDTLEWWQNQSGDHKPLNGSTPLSAALKQLAAFVEGADEVWAHSPSFDLAHLEYCYDIFEIDPPWTYTEKRDSRTIAALPIAAARDHTGREHHALDDAVHQAQLVAATLQRLQSPKTSDTDPDEEIVTDGGPLSRG